MFNLKYILNAEKITCDYKPGFFQSGPNGPLGGRE